MRNLATPLALTLLLTFGCSKPPEPKPPSTTAEVEPPPPPPPPSTEKLAPPGGPTPKQGPASTRELQRVPSEALKPGKRALPGKPLIKNGHFSIREANDRTVIVRRSTKANTREGRSYVALDLTTGQQRGPYASIRSMDLERGLLVTRDAKERQTLTHISDGATITPDITLGDASQHAVKWDIRLTDPVLVAATAGDTGETWLGVWSDLKAPQVKAPLKFPLVLNRYEVHNGAARVGRGRTLPARFAHNQDPCSGWRVPLDALTSGDTSTLRCTARGEARPGGQEAYELKDGWIFWSGGFPGDPQVTRGDDGPIHHLTLPSCKGRFHATLADPPRVLVGCNVTRGEGRHMLLWSPERSWTWQETAPDPGDLMANTYRVTGEIASPIMDGVEWDTDRVWVTRWIDLKRGVIWSGPKLDPAGYQSYPDRTIATALTEPVGTNKPSMEVVQIDFEAGTIRPLLSMDGSGCSLRQAMRDDARVVLLCESQPDPNLYVFKHHETLVLDLTKNLFWRTPLYPEALLGDGSLIATNRTQSAAESASTGTAVYRVRFE